MRNQNIGTSALDDAVYKDVVVVGNGPSGMMLSYLLAGNVPTYTGHPHPTDEMLTARLRSSAAEGRCLLEQDLQFLSQGLEGRSRSPMSLLADTLSHPGADLGVDYPSLLEWRYEPRFQVDHVVLGKGPPGGVWQTMDGNVLTISLSSWMELPDLPFKQWEAIHTAGGPQHLRNSRVPARSVARYYGDYVRAKRLGRFFRNDAVVTAVTPLEPQPSPSARWLCWQCQNSPPARPGPGVCARWRVEGYDASSSEPFSYVCRDVVLATGGHDVPNRLHVPGEAENPSWVLHNLSRLERTLDEFSADQGLCRGGGAKEVRCDPVVIVGAGLSAADAVIAARFRGLPVVHVFRSGNPQFSGRQLPEDMYPEYHKGYIGNHMADDNSGDSGFYYPRVKLRIDQTSPVRTHVMLQEKYEHAVIQVHQMMTDSGRSYRLYTALPEHKVLEISGDRKVRLQGPGGELAVCHASVVAILIGSRPDLGILPPDLELAADPSRPVDCHSNPVQVDPFTYAAVRAPEGLHALGPLAGDNFVRFILGGAIAVASDVHRGLSRKEVVL